MKALRGWYDENGTYHEGPGDRFSLSPGEARARFAPGGVLNTADPEFWRIAWYWTHNGADRKSVV